MRTLIVFIVCMVAFGSNVQAQRFTISGVITDATNGETLIGANVHAVTAGTGTAANAYGFYSLTLDAADSTTLAFTFVGFEPQVKKVYLNRDVRLNVALQPGAGLLDEVVVSAEALVEDNVRTTRMSVVDVPIRYVEQLPALLGEQDVLKVIQLLPGVQQAQEGTTGYHVRGGNADQNLVELDEATVYNPSHLFGLFSAFNSRALNNVELVKGGFPAQYGGRLSSILRVSMRDGNRQEFEGQAGVGIVSSHATIEGPLAKGKASYILSGRRSYLDLLIRPFQKDRVYYFYDLNGKLNYSAGENDRIYLSGFRGRDHAEYLDASGTGYGIRFGNSTGTLRWNHIFGPRLFSNVSLVSNEYFIRVNTIQGQFYSQNYSGINDLTAKAVLEFYPAPRHNIRIGGTTTRHVFMSTGTGGQLPTGHVVAGIDAGQIPERKVHESAVFIQDDWDSNGRFGLSAGLRIPWYSGDDTTYSAIEPRLAVRLSLTERSSFKASFTRMNQFVHLVPSTTASLPTDIWTPASRAARPQEATQYAFGYFRNFREGRYEASLEGYYKEMRNQVLFREGTQILAYQDIDRQLTFGRGWSYGAELFVKRRAGKLSGWLSYTLSWTRQRFPALNRGEVFPFRYDRRHNVSAAATYELPGKWSLSGAFVFQSGPAATLPVGRVHVSLGGELYEGLFYDYEQVNNFRMPNYHRLDVSATRTIASPRWFDEGELVIGAYNAYSRLNPYYVYLDLDIKTGEPVAKQVALLPIVPSISYNVRF
ncbi:MAG: TonB-dependent receptor [Rhodothermales bacterium]|nr:TonB-dependent receptor [Rhodothermales bacterium]MBO6778182.1 TonB-dependent receptor [Rhodothermales bacterium]